MTDDAVTVYHRETRLLMTLRITGAPRVRGRQVRETTIAAELVEIHVHDGNIRSVCAIGPTVRKDGTWGIQRTVDWRWDWAQEQIPSWLTELVRTEIGGAS